MKNISKQVIQRLQELTASRSEPVWVDPALPEPGYAVKIVADEKIGVTLILADYDRYSAALSYLEVTRNDLSPNDKELKDYLQQQAEQIVKRLTYLAEPLALVELDETEGIAQVRSAPPSQDGETITYWEAELRARPHSQVRLSRYCWSPEISGRELVAYPIAFARLGQMAEDLALSLG